MRCFLFIVWSILFLGHNSAQEEYYDFDIWEAGRTKVGSLVLDLYQDHDGFIWLSTFNGVIRFDGSHFEHIADIYPEAELMPTSHISCVRKDKANNIWIGTIGGGLFKLSADGQFGSFNDDVIAEGLLEEYRIEDIVFADSILFVQGRTGLSTFKLNRDKYQRIKDIAGIPDKSIKSVVPYKNDFLFTTKNKIVSLNGIIAEEENLKFPQVFIDKEEVLWKSLKTEEGTVLFNWIDGAWNRLEHQPLLNISPHRKFTWDYQRRLWGVKYIDDLICYNFKKEKWVIEASDLNHNLDQSRVRDVMVDNSGTVWVGSDVISLFRKREDIRSIKIPQANKDEIVNFIFDDDKILYSNSHDGFHMLDDQMNTIHYNKANSDLTHNRFVKLVHLDNGNIGLAHYGGFQLLDSEYQFSELIPTRGSNRSICMNAGYYWVGGVSKILKIDPETFQVKTFPFRSESRGQNIYINGLVPKSENELYVGSSLKELHVFNIAKEEFVKVQPAVNTTKPPISSNQLNISKEGVLAIAGENGLYTYSDNAYTLHVPRKYFKSIDWANDSLIIASTKDAIYKVNIYNNEISIISQDNGLLNSQFSLRSVFKLKNELCFGGNNGLDCISTETPKDSLSTILNFESLTINNDEKINIERNVEHVLLPQNTSHIVLKLNQIYTKNQNSALILYKNKNSSTWQELSNNTLILDNPRPGEHKFEFKSMIADYAGREKHLKIGFEIPIPWYRQFLFSLLASIVIISGLAWLVVHDQNKRKEKELHDVQLKADIAELRLKALSGQMNPHFTFNALNSILQMINEQDNENASIYVQKFSSMLRFVLEYSDQSWVSLEKEIKFLEDYLQLEKMRFNESFDYSIKSNLPSQLGQFLIPPFFLQPKIENALKHGIRGLDQGGKIEIDLKIEEDLISANIIDNGIGRAAAMTKSQFHVNSTNKGLELTLDRLDQLKKLGYEASLNITDLYEGEASTGTHVELILPLKKVKSTL